MKLQAVMENLQRQQRARLELEARQHHQEQPPPPRAQVQLQAGQQQQQRVPMEQHEPRGSTAEGPGDKHLANAQQIATQQAAALAAMRAAAAAAGAGDSAQRGAQGELDMERGDSPRLSESSEALSGGEEMEGGEEETTEQRYTDPEEEMAAEEDDEGEEEEFEDDMEGSSGVKEEPGMHYCSEEHRQPGQRRPLTGLPYHSHPPMQQVQDQADWTYEEQFKQDQLQQKIVCPGIVTCLAVSPNGLYVTAGIEETIYLWEVSTGNLLLTLSRHYQELTCIRFTDDSSHFISGGKDNLVIVWNLSSLLQISYTRVPEPQYVWSRHTLPVTDIHCGVGGPLSRVATASLDQTVKLWEISCGELLMSVLFDVGIMSVTLDPCEYYLFCGGNDGSIFQVNLFAAPVQREKNFQTDKDGSQIFKGHRNQVTCLSVSIDGTLLISGSHDETVRLWDIPSKQCLRTVSHKGPVTNAFLMIASANMFNPDCRPSTNLPKFSKHVRSSEITENEEGCAITMCLQHGQKEAQESYLKKSEQLYSVMCAAADKHMLGDGENTKMRVAELEDEVKTLKKINRDLYDFSVQVLTKQT